MLAKRVLSLLLVAVTTTGCIDGGDSSDELGSIQEDISQAPSNLVATITGPTTLNLTWTAVTGATGYVIQRSNTSGTETNYTSASPATSTTFNDSHLTANTQFCYVVRANVLLAGGISPPSNEQCVTTSSGPSAPTGVSALATSSTSITVTWNAVPTATLYYVFEAVGTSTTFAQIGTATPPATSFVVNGLAPSTTYKFEVRTGFIGGVVSGFSTPPASATTFPAGLEAYYRYDDKTGTSAVDRSGFNRTATLSGGAVFSTTQQAPLRDEFDKNPSSLSLPTATSVASTAAISTNFNADATISLWVNVPTLPTGTNVTTFAGRRDAGCGANQAWALGDNATGLFFAGAAGVIKPFGKQLTPGTFTQVAVTQHAGTIKMYVNGALVNTLAYTGGPTSTGAFDVGAVGGCPNTGPFFIDELKIFSRTLTTTEVDTLGHAPTAPTNLNALEIHSNRVKLGYTAPTTGADKYYMFRGTAAGNEVFFTSNTPTTFLAGNMTPSQTTSWKVLAQKNGLLSTFSNELVVTTLAPPPPPTNLTATLNNCCNPKRVDLAWTAEPRAVVYKVFMSTSGGPFTLLSAPTGTSLQVANLAHGTTYAWNVESQDDGFTVSVPSATVTATVP